MGALGRVGVWLGGAERGRRGWWGWEKGQRAGRMWRMYVRMYMHIYIYIYIGPSWFKPGKCHSVGVAGAWQAPQRFNRQAPASERYEHHRFLLDMQPLFHLAENHRPSLPGMPAEHGSGTAFGTDAVPAGSDTNTHAGESGDIRNPAAATEEHFGVETSNTSTDDLHPAVTNTSSAEQGTPGHDDRRSMQ